MLTDPELLRRYAENRSETAFTELVQRHLNFVYSVALRHVGGDSHAAQDVAQKVFVDLARRAAQLSRRSVLGGWLYRSAQFRAIDVVRSERRRRVREEKAETMNAMTSSPPSLDGNLIRPALDKAIGGLNERDRDAVLLRFFEGKAFAEIGTALRLTEDGARMRVDRALEKMRLAMARGGVTSTTAALAMLLANQTMVAAPAGLAASVTGAALASTAVAGSSALALFELFSHAKAVLGVSTAVWVGAAVGLPAIGAAVYEFREAGRDQRALATVAAEREAIATQLSALDASVREAAWERSTLQAEVKALQIRLAAAAAKRDPAAEGRKLLAEHPEVRAMLIASGTPKVAQRYHPFYRLANLTPAQIERFEYLIAATWADSLMVTPTGILPEREPTPEQFRAILGDQGYAQLQNYDGMMQAYQFTDLVAARVSAAAEPLSAAQIDQLAIAIADSSSLYRASHLMGDHLSFPEAMAAVDWSAVLDRAQAILSPAQWTAAQSPLLNAQVMVAVAQAGQNRASPPAMP